MKLSNGLDVHFDWLVSCVQGMAGTEADLVVVTEEGSRHLLHRLTLTLHSPLISSILQTLPPTPTTLFFPVSGKSLLDLLQILNHGAILTNSRAELLEAKATAETLGIDLTSAKIGTKRKKPPLQREDIKPEISDTIFENGSHTNSDNDQMFSTKRQQISEDTYQRVAGKDQTYELRHNLNIYSGEDKQKVSMKKGGAISQKKLKGEIQFLEQGLALLIESKKRGLDDGNLDDLITTKQKEAEEKKRKLKHLCQSMKRNRKIRSKKSISKESSLTDRTEESKTPLNVEEQTNQEEEGITEGLPDKVSTEQTEANKCSLDL